MLGYGEKCSEANLAVRFTKSEAKTKSAKKYVILQALKHKPMDYRMSCYQLTDRHHASIARFVQCSFGWTEKQTQHLADKLKRCNLQSVNYRYNENKPMDKCKTDNFKMLDSTAYHGAVRCWAYNSGNDPQTPDFNSVLTFLFSLVPGEFGIEKSIDHWVIV